MNEKNIFPICFSSGVNFFSRDEEKYKSYIEKYERSKDGCLQYVTAIIRNEVGNILVGFNKKHGSRQIPSGKIDKGETHQMAIKREILEETDLQIENSKYLGTSKVVLNGMMWQGNFYETEVKGILKAKEVDTMDVFKWVNFIKTDSRLGFGIIDGEKTIVDPLEILEKWHMFTEVFWLYSFPLYKGLSGKIHLTNNYSPEEKYIQYRDQENNSLEIKKYKDFLSKIE